MAYDLATGFGLLRPLLPLRNVAVASLGSSRDLQPGEPLMAVTGPQPDDDGGVVSMTRLVSRRAFSGSWEYHIQSLRCSPARRYWPAAATTAVRHSSTSAAN